MSERPLHNSRYLPSEDTYKCGEDVIVESYLHSNADFMICLPGSNVNYFSRYLNPNLKSITYLSEQMKKDYPHFENVEYTYN